MPCGDGVVDVPSSDHRGPCSSISPGRYFTPMRFKSSVSAHSESSTDRILAFGQVRAMLYAVRCIMWKQTAMRKQRSKESYEVTQKNSIQKSNQKKNQKKNLFTL